jgi:hypothetical protein
MTDIKTYILLSANKIDTPDVFFFFLLTGQECHCSELIQGTSVSGVIINITFEFRHLFIPNLLSQKHHTEYI